VRGSGARRAEPPPPREGRHSPSAAPGMKSRLAQLGLPQAGRANARVKPEEELMPEPEVEAELITGTVKSWNGSKGYGFITSDQVDGDVFFSRSELPPEAHEVRGTFLEGRAVSFQVLEGTDGRAKASDVQILAMEDQPLAGMIKSYSEQNRYGFVTSSSLTDDVRFQNSDLPPMTSGANLKGKLVIFDMQQLPDGKLRVTKMQFQTSGIAAANAFGGGFGGGGFGGGAFGGGAFGKGAFGKGGFRGAPGAARGFAPAAPMAAPQLGGGMVTGTVKSFSDRHGYGFINTPGQMQDIKFGKADLLMDSVAAGALVSFMPSVSHDGRIQARQVQPASAKRMGSFSSHSGTGLALRPQKQARTGGGWVTPRAKEVAAGQIHSGTVKSYIPSKGFGFITCPDVPGDIYFMRQVLPLESQNAELKGLPVTCEIAIAPDGKFRAQSVGVP